MPVQMEPLSHCSAPSRVPFPHITPEKEELEEEQNGPAQMEEELKLCEKEKELEREEDASRLQELSHVKSSKVSYTQ